MKLIAVFLTTLFVSLTSEWGGDFTQAQHEASQSHKYILLNFSGSDWCAPCIKLKKDIFESDAFKAYAAEHLVLVRADFPRLKKNQLEKKQTEHNEMLAEKYNPQGKFPLTLLLNPDGKIVKEWEGYVHAAPAEFVEQVNGITHAGK